MTEKEWAAFLSRQDMIWTAAPEKWEDGAFIGNGRMGAMIYRDPADGGMMLELGRNDIYDNRDEEAEGAASLFSNERLPVGRLYLRLKGQMKSWKMRLDLWGAALCFSAETTAGSVAGEIFACADRQLIAGQFQTSGSERAEWEFVPAVSESPRQAYGIHHQDPARIQKGFRPNPPARQWKEGDICFALQELSRGAGIATAFRRAARKNGKIVLARLKSLAGEPLRLAGAGDLKPREPEGCCIYKTAEGDWFTDNLAAGEEISFFCEGEETVLEPVEQKFHKGFRYGISD